MSSGLAFHVVGGRDRDHVQLGECEFLAKRIRTFTRFDEPVPDWLASQQSSITLASPLFIAFAD